jgi:hypothetical protein
MELRVVQDVLVESFDEIIPGVADSVRFQLRTSLRVLLKVRPQIIADANPIGALRQDQIVPSVGAYAPKVVCEQILFASGKSKLPLDDEPLFAC